MIDPYAVTQYNLKPHELEETILFWICAAGKNGVSAAAALERFMAKAHDFLELDRRQPFFAVQHFSQVGISNLMKQSGIGCYGLKSTKLPIASWT